MTQLQMIETIQQVYPDVGETEIRIFLTRGNRKFIEKTRLLTRSDCTATHVANQRMYALSDFTNISDADDVLAVFQVDDDEIPMDRLIGEPSETDIT